MKVPVQMLGNRGTGRTRKPRRSTDNCQLPTVNSCHGFTLVEVVVVITVLAGLLGSVLAIYFMGMQSWRRGVPEGRTRELAAWALKRMDPDIRQAMALTAFPAPCNGYGITLRLPARTYDSGEQTYFNTISVGGDGRPYLVQGNQVSYYRGDAAGSASLSGDRIWRVLTTSEGGELRREVIVQGVVDNAPDATGNPKPMFIYWPDMYRLKSVEVTVNIRMTEAGRTAAAQISGETALRNK